jgi:hypothetical protein
MLGLFTLYMALPTFAVVSLYIIIFGFGSHALFGVWSSEIFPTKSRAAATSVIFSLARGLAVGGWLAGVIGVAFGLSFGMIILGSTGFILMVLLPFILPETKGKEMNFE